jgi:hypothetical protein
MTIRTSEIYTDQFIRSAFLSRISSNCTINRNTNAALRACVKSAFLAYCTKVNRMSGCFFLPFIYVNAGRQTLH